MLLTSLKRRFEHDGYLVLHDVLGSSERQALIERAHQIIAEADLSEASRFSTTERSQIDNDYFLDSAETIRCFFEEQAFDADGRLVRPRAQSVNKIGHALHDHDPLFQQLALRPDLGDLARDLGLKEPHLYQTMVIFKQPRIGGEVTWHQDASFFLTEPSSVLTFWFALEEATLDNGCLWVQPSGHEGPLRERYSRNGGELTMLPLDETPWPDARQSQPVPLPAGSLLLFHGHLPHCSAANRSERSRLALTFHVVDGTLPYASDNWLQRPQLGPFVMPTRGPHRRR